MHSFLIWLNLSRIKIISLIIPKRPYNAHEWIGILKPIEIFTAYPSAFILIFAVKSIFKERHAVGDVIGMDFLELVRQQCCMCYCASSGKDIIKMFCTWQMFQNPFSKFAL